jgi:hypothetical protein
MENKLKSFQVFIPVAEDMECAITSEELNTLKKEAHSQGRPLRYQISWCLKKFLNKTM